MTVDLTDWQARFMLEALQNLDDRWKAVIAAAAKGDEDTQTDRREPIAR